MSVDPAKTPGKIDPVTSSHEFGTMEIVSEDFKPPYLLCAGLAAAALLLGGGFFWWDAAHPPQSVEAAAALSGLPGPVSQVLRLKSIYEHPPMPEDPSKYSRSPSSKTKRSLD